jgi:membrane-associated phospholipid phosphatase
MTLPTTPAARRGGQGGAGRYGATRYRWMDVVTMGYMAATGALHLLLGHGSSGWPSAVLLHFGYVLFGLEVVRASQLRPASAVLRELRTFYPAFIIIYGFFDATHLQNLISKGEFWASDLMVDIDYALFGVHPTVWIGRWHRPWLDELVCFFNISYYLIPFVYAVPMVLSGRRLEVWAGASIVLFTYVVNYTLFLLLPALGPRMIPAVEALRTSTLESGEGPFVWLQYLVQGENGAARGAAFPSAHVSASVAWSMVAWHYDRRIALVTWPLALGTAFSTVYLGFHHAIDPLAGFLLGGACYWVGLRILRARGEDPLADRAAAARQSRPADLGRPRARRGPGPARPAAPRAGRAGRTSAGRPRRRRSPRRSTTRRPPSGRPARG